MTSEEMKAELEAAGYTFKYWHEDGIETPDGNWVTFDWDNRDLINKAYAHLQQHRELAMWRDMASKIWAIDEDTMHHNTFNATVSREAMIAIIRYRNHNITADDESDET